MKVVIVKYNAGNILSVQYALRRIGLEAVVSDDHDLIRSADKVIFPGVGEARNTMAYLKDRNLDRLLQELTQPVLGICLGLQLMCRHSEESDTDCIRLFDVGVKRFPPGDKVPHMGWNAIKELKGRLFAGISSGSYVYFVHSYYAELHELTSATCEYMIPFSAAIEYNNYFATQFHPEKSGETGERILKNFLSI
jgi:glutamine amidotransferase